MRIYFLHVIWLVAPFVTLHAQVDKDTLPVAVDTLGETEAIAGHAASGFLPVTGIDQFYPDSIQRKTWLKKFVPATRGNISAGYEYGIIPFGPRPGTPMGYYSTQGILGLTLLGLPLTASFYYSSLENVAGLNNYFRLSFDPQQYRERLQEEAYRKVEAEKKRLSGLLDIQQGLQQKIVYQEMILKKLPDQKYVKEKLRTYQSHSLKGSAIDTLNAMKDVFGDSLDVDKNALPSVPYADSVRILKSYLQRYDSASERLARYKQQYDAAQRKINAIRNKLQYLEHPEQIVRENNPYIKRTQAMLSGIKTLDIGLCYPNHSTFLVNGSTLKGVNIEWEKKLYFAFTYGKTINTLLTTNNLIQNQLQTGRNLFNFFDFGNVRDVRKIIAVKGGIGAKEATHLHVGVLYGYGLTSYLNPLFASPEQNAVFEIDARYKLNEKNILDVIYGKSALFHDSQYGNNGEAVNAQLTTQFRSNAMLIKYTSEISRTKTKIVLGGRLVDPFFTSYGVGFMRSDNLRMEGKVEQQLSGKIKLTGFYRRDQDNLLGMYRATSDLQTMGLNLYARINRRLTVRAVYTPVVQRINSADSVLMNGRTINNITTSVINYTPRLGKVVSVFSLLGNYYQLSNAGNYQSYTLSNMTSIGKFRSEVAGNYFYNNVGDSLNRTVLLLLSGSLNFKGGSATIGAKFASNTAFSNQVGAIARLSMPLFRYVSLEVSGERLVTGDFYSYYSMTEIARFPYNFQGRVVVLW